MYIVVVVVDRSTLWYVNKRGKYRFIDNKEDQSMYLPAPRRIAIFSKL